MGDPLHGCRTWEHPMNKVCGVQGWGGEGRHWQEQSVGPGVAGRCDPETQECGRKKEQPQGVYRPRLKEDSAWNWSKVIPVGVQGQGRGVLMWWGRVDSL